MGISMVDPHMWLVDIKGNEISQPEVSDDDLPNADLNNISTAQIFRAIFKRRKRHVCVK